MPSRFGSAPVISGRERRRGDLRQIAQQLHVGRRMAEVIVGDQRAIGLAAERAELALVDRLEQRALVPARAGIGLQIAVELHLADVQHVDLERRVGLGVEDEIVQAAPGALELLEFRRVQDLVHLRAELLVETRDHLLDRVEHVALDDGRIGERLRDQRLDRVLDLGRGALAARLEILLQERRRTRPPRRRPGRRPGPTAVPVAMPSRSPLLRLLSRAFARRASARAWPSSPPSGPDRRAAS